MKNISNLVYININSHLLEKWDPKDHVKSWMINHRPAENPRKKIMAISYL